MKLGCEVSWFLWLLQNPFSFHVCIDFLMPNPKLIRHYCSFLFFLLQIQNTFRIEALEAECTSFVHLLLSFAIYLIVCQFIKFIAYIKWVNTFTCLKSCLVHSAHSVDVNYFHSFIHSPFIEFLLWAHYWEVSTGETRINIICHLLLYQDSTYLSYLLDCSLHGVRDTPVSFTFVSPVSSTRPDVL